MRILTPGRLSSWCVLLTAARLGAEVASLPAVADTTLFELDPDHNFGRQPTLPAGAIGEMVPADGHRARALFKFDVLGALPPGAVIESAVMRLSISTRIPGARRNSSDFVLHCVLVEWGEGAGFGEIPGGRLAQAGEATWNNRMHPNVPWSIPGGALGTDFAAAESALAENVDGSRVTATTYEFPFNQQGLQDLEMMADGTVPNHGWMLRSLGEDSVRTARHWISKDPLDPPRPLEAGPLPELEITYSLPLAPPVLKSVTLDPDTQELVVRVDGEPGLSYQLQSGDLANWQPTGAAQVPQAKSELEFRLPLVAPTRFVRVEATRTP